MHDTISQRPRPAGEIRALLLRDITNPPTLAAIAKLLEVSDRSLRRQLREQGISFRGLLDELRMRIALRYLRTTRLANEDIALALGFSDATNFRRAFRRWPNLVLPKAAAQVPLNLPLRRSARRADDKPTFEHHPRKDKGDSVAGNEDEEIRRIAEAVVPRCYPVHDVVADMVQEDSPVCHTSE